MKRAAIPLLVALTILGLGCSSATEGRTRDSAALANAAADLPTARTELENEDTGSHGDADASLSSPVAARLQEALSAARASQKILGAAAMVVTPRGTWRGATGFADVRRTIALTADHHFRIGSITKTFTAAITLELIEQGLFALDTKIDRWLPELPNAGLIRVEELLNHTSGLYDYAADPASDLPDFPPPERFLEIAARHPAVFSPGSNWEYSNTNYVALGVIIERSTGRSLASEIETRVSRPSGLADTYLPMGPERPGLAQGSMRDGSGFLDITDRTYSKFHFADGGLTSSVADVMRWNKALLDGTVVGGAMLERMMTKAPHSDGAVGAGTAYGLGLLSTTTSLGTSFGHGGGMYGFMCNSQYDPASGVGVTVLTNSDESDPFTLVEQLAAIAR